MSLAMIQFAERGWLWAALLIPVLFLAIRWDEESRKRKFNLFIDPSLWMKIAPEIDWGARLRKAGFLLGALFFGLLALARPQWGTHEETSTATGLDIMVALDLSNSMECEDVIPSRIKKAKHIIKTLMEKTPGDRIGIVAFAGSSYVAVPLTSDYDYVWETLQNLSPKLIQNQGTDIGLGLETAMHALDRGSEEDAHAGSQTIKTSRTIVLISDGEDHEDGAVSAARQVGRDGIQLFAIGVGTQKGAPVPVKDDSGITLTYKKDSKGEPVISHFMPDALMEVAKSAEGRYFNATADESEVGEIVNSLGGLSRAEYAERTYLVHEDRFQYPLAVAVALLLIEFSAPARKMAALLLIASLSAGLVGSPSAKASPRESEDEISPDSIQTYLDNRKGLKSYQEGQMEEAEKNFGSAQARDPDRPELFFNEGAVAMKKEDYDSAIQAFTAAARGARAGGKQDLEAMAKYNLAQALAKKKDYKDAAKSYISSIDAAQKAKDSELEEQARKNLQLLAQQKQQQQQQQQQEQNQDQNQKENQNQQKQDQSNSEKNQKQNQPKRYQDETHNSRKKFQSQKLSNDDANRVMAELTNRERELQARLKKSNGESQRNQKDW